MKITAIVLCILIIFHQEFKTKVHCILEDFYMNADELLNSAIGNQDVMPGLTHVFKESPLTDLVRNMTGEMNVSDLYTIPRPGFSTTIRPTPLTTPKLKDSSILQPGYTWKEIKIRMKRREIQNLVYRRENHMESIKGDTDDIDEITKDFELAKSGIETENYRRQNIRPEDYYPSNLYYPTKTHWPEDKNRTMKLLHHWIYKTQHILVHAQQMRVRYMPTVRFKMGYCFAMLTELKRTEMLLYLTYYYHFKKHQFLMWHLQLYEKMSRLDTDIKNLVTFIYILEEKREEYEDRWSEGVELRIENGSIVFDNGN